MSFGHDGYAVLPRMLQTPACEFLDEYARRALEAGKFVLGDTQVPETPRLYGDPVFETLMEVLQPRIELETGLVLDPTYSYVRVYMRGDMLPRHKDRPACEISVTLNLARRGPNQWPVWIDTAVGPRAIELEPGDALMYRGIDIEHWREPFVGEQLIQVFLHYVDRAGPHRDWAFDKRPRPGTSSSARRILEAIGLSALTSP